MNVGMTTGCRGRSAARRALRLVFLTVLEEIVAGWIHGHGVAQTPGPGALARLLRVPQG